MWGPQYSFGVFFKPLATEFEWTRAETSAAMTINLFIGGALGFVGGGLSDRYGPRKVMSASAILVGIGYLLLSRLGGLWELYLWFGLVVGVGMSTAYIVPAANVSRWFVEKRGLGLGITLAGMSVSQIVIPPLVAVLIAGTSWRNAYLLIGIGVLAVVLSLAGFLKKSPEDCGLLPDGKKTPHRPPGAVIVSLEGISLKESLRLPAFWLIFFLWVFGAVPAFVMVVHVVPLATDAGIGPVEAAVILSFIGAAGIGGRSVFGAMCDRWGCRASGALGMGLVGLSMAGMVFARSPVAFYAAGAVFGMGYTGADTALVKLVGDFFGLRAVGAIMGALAVGWRIGASLGAIMGGIIFDITRRYEASFMAGSLCALAGVALIFILFRCKPQLKAERGPA